MLHLGRMRSSSSWLPELLRPGKAQNSGLLFCGELENPNLSGLGLGGACNSGPAPCRVAAWSLSSVDREGTHAASGGKPGVAGTLRVLPTQASDICLQRPSLPAA